MAQVKWRLEGEWMKNCNCAFGCPCDFNAKPTNGHCEGLLGMRITQGQVEDVHLDGLIFFGRRPILRAPDRPSRHSVITVAEAALQEIEADSYPARHSQK